MYRVLIYENPEIDIPIEIHSPYNNQLKVESDSLKPSINDIGSFEFTLYPDNPGWGHIKPLQTLIKVEDVKHGLFVFEGRVLAPTTEQTDERVLSESYLCEDEKGYLHDSVQSWKKFTGKRTGEQLFREAIKVHNSQVEDYKKFTVGKIEMEDLTENIRYIDDEQDTFDTITTKLLGNDNIGGELQIRKENGVRYIDWLKQVGKSEKTVISLRKNMLEMTKELDPTDVVTQLFPRGATVEDENNNDQSKPRLTIASVNGNKEYLLADERLINEFGIQSKAVLWDDITQANILKTKAQQWLDNQLIAQGKLTIKALDLSLLSIDPERFWIGNSYPVKNPLMNIDESLRIVDMNIKINQPEETELNFGERSLTLSQYQKALTKERKQLANLRLQVESQARTVTGLKSNLEQTEKNLSELQSSVETENGNVQNQISSIIDELQNMVTEMQTIANAVPSAETMQSISTSISDLNVFKQSQDQLNDMQNRLNSDFEQRLKKLEETGGDN